MSLSSLKAELHGRTGKNLMPSCWPIESLISWCREVAKHDDKVLSAQDNNELFDLMKLLIEELLIAQDSDRLNQFRKNSDSLFDVLARELDEIVRNELVSQIIRYDIGRVALKDLFRDHFPAGLGLVALVQQVDQSHATAVLAGPAD
jgi:hypothetical protein